MKTPLPLLSFLVVSVLASPALAQDAAPIPPADDQPAALPGAPAPSSPAASPQQGQPAAQSPGALPAAPSSYGSLEIVTDQPGAEVVIDGARVGRTPLRVDGLTSGQHQVQITRDGGAPMLREVTVQEGLTVRMDASVAGGPARPLTGDMGNATPAATAPAGQQPTKSLMPGREFFGTFLEQPWAWVAAAITGVVMLAAAILWTANSPQAVLPFGLGEKYLSGVNTTAFLVVKWGVVVTAGVMALITLGLFLWPSLPFAKMVQLPSLTNLFGKKDEKPAQPAAAPAPQQK